jgi:hypothetical protein
MLQLENRVTAYVDILGFREVIDHLNELEDKLASIERTLYLIRDKASAVYVPAPPAVECLSTTEAPRIAFGKPLDRTVEMSAFSDCFTISDTGQLAYTVVARVQELAFTLLETEGVLCRGGIVQDRLHHRNGVTFGRALVRAHDLESRVASYPRIVVEDAFAERYLAWEKELQRYVQAPPAAASVLSGLSYPKLLRRDGDGCYFVDLFVPIPDVVPTGWNLDGIRWPERFRRVRSRLAERLAETVSGARPDHVAKIRWLIARFNEGVQTGEFRRRVCNIEPIAI